jgi:hypothetical protein
LAFASGESQDFQIVTDRDPCAVSFTEQVIGDPKVACRKHVFTILVVLERARLTDQRIDHVAVVDRGTTITDQSWHSLNMILVM